MLSPRTVRSPAERRAERDESRRAVLDAAERLLAADGWSGLSMRRLADEAGTSSVAIYALFGDKAGMEDELLRRSVSSLQDAVATGDEPAQSLRFWAHEHPARFELLFDAALQPAAAHLDDVADDMVAVAFTVMGAAAGDADAAREDPGLALTALAALVGYLRMERAGLLPDGWGQHGFDRLVGAVGRLSETFDRPDVSSTVQP